MNRTEVWAPCGVNITGSLTIEDALNRAELNWDVEKRDVYDANHNKIEDWFATTRTDNNAVLGMVGNKYSIIQNRDAFDFTQALVGEGMEFERAGVWRYGKAVWVEAKLPESRKILGDDVDCHAVFVNSHDGKGSVKVCILPNRLYCSNQLNFALTTAERKWSVVHSMQIYSKLEEARLTLDLAGKYMDALEANANDLAMKKVSLADFDRVINQVFPVSSNMSQRKIDNILSIREGLHNALIVDDNYPYKDTAWGALGAVTDFFDHRDPVRMSSTTLDNRWESTANGNPIVDAFYERLSA